MKVVNPETGREVVGPASGQTVELHGLVTVKVTPGIRPGLAFDLSTYPASWIVEEES